MALTPANMAEALWIGAADGKNFFNVGIGQGVASTPNDHIDYTMAQIEAGFTDADKFYLDNTTHNPVFRINAGAGTTSTNTVHPRSELRELTKSGANAAWDGRTNVHQMQGRSRMISFSDARSWICFFQAHGSSTSPNTSDLFRVQTEGTTANQTTNLDVVCRRTPPSGGSEIRTVLRAGNYNQNDWISWQTAINAGRLTIAFDGVSVLDVSGMGQIDCYWKTGCYLQDGPTHGATATSWGAVEMEKGSLQVWHTGYPAPTTPVFTGPDDGGGAAADTTPPTVPDDLAAIRGDTSVTLVWQASTDDVGVDHYVVTRTAVGGGGGTSIATLGKTDDGPATSASSSNKTIVSKYTADQSGTLVAGHARLWTDTGSATNVKMVVYADTAGVPTTQLAVSDTITVSNTTEAQKDFTFSGGAQISITSGTVYWIGVAWPDPGTNNINWSRNATTGQTQQSTSTAPSPFGTPGTALSGPIDAYIDVQYTSDGSSTSNVSTTTVTQTGLTNGVEYTYTVAAVDAAGNASAPTDPVTVTPGAPDTTAPTVPGSLTATAGDRQVELAWTASTDADSGLHGYRVYRDGVLVATPSDGATGYTDVGLANGHQYTYAVSAVDNSLNESAQTAGASATPTAALVGGVPWLTGELGRRAKLGVEAAFGADLAADPASWTWTDITADVRHDPGISTSLGRNDESSTSNPAEFTCVLTNTTGDYSKGGRSRWWPYIRRNTPVRGRIDPGDGGGPRTVFFGGANGWTPGWDAATGKIPVVALSASGTLRRLAQGDAPIQSSYRRALTNNSTVQAYWPMEEGVSSAFAPAVRGGTNMTVTAGTPDWAADDSFFCSDKLPTLKDGLLDATVNPYSDTGLNQVRMLMKAPEASTTIPANASVLAIATTGTITWDIVLGAGSLTLNRYASDGTFQGGNTFGYALADVPGRLSFSFSQSGGNVTWRLGWVPASTLTAEGFNTGTVTGATAGIVSRIRLNAHRNAGDVAVGHVTLENAVTSAYTDLGPLTAFDTEVASSGAVNPFTSRLERLCHENGVLLTRYTSTQTGSAGAASFLTDFDRMGPQLVAPLLDLLHEAEAADGGQLWDGRSHGLAYTARRRREDGDVALTIDASKGELADDFAPTDDDQRTRNKVEVKRTHGITSVYEDVDGPLGTATIGTYDDSVTLNLGRDQDVTQHAQWLVSLGTADVEGYRYPQVTVDLRAAPRLAADVLDIIPGERLDVVGLDDTLDEFTAPSVSLIVEGIAHEITAKSWRVMFRCSLFEPWAVGRVAHTSGDTSDMVMRLDTDGSSLAAHAERGFTALSVATDATAALWTTRADDYPLWLEIGGLPVRATACLGVTSPQVMTVDALPIPRAVNTPVQLWQPRRLGMGASAPFTVAATEVNDSSAPIGGPTDTTYAQIFAEEFDEANAAALLANGKWWFGWWGDGVLTVPVNDTLETASYDVTLLAVSGGIGSFPVTPNVTNKAVSGHSAKANLGTLISTDPAKGASPGFTMSYGYVEARIWQASGNGTEALWPAFWLVGSPWPDMMEVDVLEGDGTISGNAWNIHYGIGSDTTNLNATTHSTSVTGYATGWHTYAADIYVGGVDWYYDGLLVGSYIGTVPDAQRPLIVNHTTAGTLAGTKTMQVDYVRAWTRTAALLATETWPGADGASWPAQWTITANSGTATVQSGAGQLTSPASSFGVGAMAYLSGMPARQTLNLTMTVTWASVAEQYTTIALGADGTVIGGTSVPANGYCVLIDPRGFLVVKRSVSGTATDIGNATPSIGAGTAYNLRFLVIPQTGFYGVRIWSGATEPSTWAVSGTDGSPYTAGGRLQLQHISGTAATARTVSFDNLAIHDMA